MGEVTDVQRTLKVILSEGAEPTAMSSSEFQAAVRDGKIVGETPVWGRIFTSGEWQIAADLRIFHSATPNPVALGPYLQKIADAEKAAAAGPSIDPLAKVNALVSTADERRKASGAEAVWILMVSPAFRRAEILIVEDRGATFVVERVLLKSMLYMAVLDVRQQAVINYPDLPALARDRRAFEQLLAAPLTRTGYVVFDGVGCRLQYASHDTSISAEWSSPTTAMPRESQITTLAGELIHRAFGERPEIYEIAPEFKLN